MTNVEKAKDAIEKAQRSFVKMKEATSFVVFKDEWKNFLDDIKSVWEKIQTHCDKLYGFDQWRSKRQKDFNDPLLAYVREARNADQHGIEEIIDHKPTLIEIGPPKGQAIYRISGIRLNPGNYEYKEMNTAGKTQLRTGKIKDLVNNENKPVRIRPGKIRLLSVFDKNGIPYPPPKKHLGKPINENNIYNIAELAIKYYKELAEDAEKTL